VSRNQAWRIDRKLYRMTVVVSVRIVLAPELNQIGTLDWLLRQRPGIFFFSTLAPSTKWVLKSIVGVAAWRLRTDALRMGFVLHEGDTAGGLGPSQRNDLSLRAGLRVIHTAWDGQLELRSYPKHSSLLAARSESRPGIFVTADLALHHRSCVGAFGNLKCGVENGLYGHSFSPSR
jgi:hypothetical protein